ncbi:enoyl-CoA hydratase [Amycolatopsis acidiphila]|uniref:enoyl-CoA hydratase n=1 Tax=Amycolatopsis acidiphila TaxID=715473 RepID=UPI0019C36A51|nr:enoyl-CoA hydratase [Amycolatopsis acidiphila]UIJ63249.1 enoyl-CoA hydratase [Amycolatopsis acidiphila]GHG74600.1 enoyl-CoA hydratase [Amycolatopsis acidiphila]
MNELLIEDAGAVRVLTLNRPRARNALSGELITALYRALLEVDADDAVRAVVLTGTDPAFCAGVDLKQAAAEGVAYFRRFDEENCVGQVALVGKPVVGAVNGAAFTGGLELALGCDFLVASERAVFADTHVRVGVLPGGGLTARLPQLVGPAQARRMSMTGEVVDAARAASIGLVTEVVPHERLRERALGLAAAIAEVPPAAMSALKRIYTESATSLIGRALEIETAISGAHDSDLAGLEERRVAVTRRNRAQLSRG